MSTQNLSTPTTAPRAGRSGPAGALSRRAFGRGALGLLAASVAGAGLAAPALTTPARADGPTVSMRALLLAAQVDPARPDKATTPGAEAAVRTVEDALVAAGTLDAAYADGSFGSKTVAAYAAFQESLGYSGLAANGLPGAGSLKKLGEGRFTVTDEIAPGEHVEVDGQTLNTRTRDMYEAARKKLDFPISLSQGSYSTGVQASAGTHDGGGAVDVSGGDLSADQRTAVARALREVGFAAWVRTPDQGFAYHIHGIAISDPDLASGAASQVGSYYTGGNGLADNGPDDGPDVPKVTWEDYLAGGGAR